MKPCYFAVANSTVSCYEKQNAKEYSMNPFSNLFGFKMEKECDYNNEHYSVRDNGSIKRHSKPGCPKRKYDDVWTFGTSSHDGYALIGKERIHRIVATAFHGEAPSPNHVVDHLDTNRKNNRPENLCWKTREENILTNEITCKKIEYRTGLPIKEVLKDLSILHSIETSQNYDWMRPVTEEESKHSIANWITWIKSNEDIHHIDFSKLKVYYIGFYTCYPTYTKSNILIEYFNNLKQGNIIYKSNQFTTTILESTIDDNHQTIYVKCHSPGSVKPWVLYTIKYINHKIEHSYITCFARESLDKYNNEALGIPWTGGDVIDDFC